MIFYFDGALSPLNTIPSAIHENSSNANEIMIVAPFEPNTVFNIRLQKANGEVVTDKPMTARGSLRGVVTPQGTNFAIWTFPILSYLSAFAGRLKAQVTAYAGHRVVASTEIVMPILKGVPVLPPETAEAEDWADVWAEVLGTLTTLLNKVYDIEGTSGLVYNCDSSNFVLDTDDLTAYVVDYDGSNDITELKIPPYVTYTDVDEETGSTTTYYLSVVGVEAFFPTFSNLKRIILPETLTYIGEDNEDLGSQGFQRNTVDTLVIPASVTHLYGNCLPTARVIVFNGDAPTANAKPIDNNYSAIDCIVICPKTELEDYNDLFDYAPTTSTSTRAYSVKISYLDEATIFIPAEASVSDTITDEETKARLVLHKPINLHDIVYYFCGEVDNYYCYFSAEIEADGAIIDYLRTLSINKNTYECVGSSFDFIDMSVGSINASDEIKAKYDITSTDGDICAPKGSGIFNGLSVEKNDNDEGGDAQIEGDLNVGGKTETGVLIVDPNNKAYNAETEFDILEAHIADKNNPHEVTKSQVGLGNVDNTSDLSKPISNATQAAFNAITEKIPSDASSSNKLTSHDTVADMINSITAYQITYTAEGAAFPSKAALTSAATYYSGGEARTPTQNDYAYVLQDESLTDERITEDYTSWDSVDDYVGSFIYYDTGSSFVYVLITDDNKGSLGITAGTTAAYKFPTARYSYQGVYGEGGQWAFQIIVNEAPFTQKQLDAINSGITSAKVTSYDNHLADTNNPHSVTKAQVGLGNVDNTSDLNKPISTATQTALDGKLPTTTKYGAGISLSIDSITGILSAQLKDQNGDNLGFAAELTLPFDVITLIPPLPLSDYADGKPRIYEFLPPTAINEMYIGQIFSPTTNVYVFELEGLVSRTRYVSPSGGLYLPDATFEDIMVSTYQDDYALDSDLATKQNTLVAGTNMDTAPTQNSTNPVTSGGVYNAVEAVANIANGKNTGYTIALTGGGTNSSFNNQNNLLTITQSSGVSPYIKTTSNENISLSNLKVGDSVFIVDNDIPDRWYGGKETIGVGPATVTHYYFYAYESKVDLSGYATLADLSTALTNYQPKLTQSTDLSSTSVTVTLTANSRYALGTLTALNITFPASGNDGDTIIIEFVSGSTATTLTRDTTKAIYNFDSVGSGVFVEFNAEYKVSIGKWVVYSAETEYSV